ncbi:MAG: lytic transglycosylase domain-containing protein [Alphaproteobacteria bacterium]|nr:lytic transglycosylase domain-containing protein [Alphaproteobacteria bacterium]
MNFLINMALSLSLQLSAPLQQNNFTLDVPEKKADHCHVLFDKAEKEHGILPQLLKAVAHVESGRWDPASKSQGAWPWTVTVKGKGQYFNTKAEAIKEIKRLKSNGIHDFDVGLMQINNYWHKDAFASAEEALDPETNIAYGAKFLKDLFHKHKSWTKAIACYHSYNPKYNQAYCKRVLTAWGKVKTTNYERLYPKMKLCKKSSLAKNFAVSPKSNSKKRQIVRIYRRHA